MRFHTSLPVKNIKETTAFYSTLFGEEPAKVKSDYVKFLPQSGGLNISFHEAPDQVDGLTRLHMGFEVSNQAAIDEAHARLKAAGLISVERETSICCYANQDKIWVKDPSGYEWEIYILLEDSDIKIEKKSNCCAPDDVQQAGTGCC